MSRIGNCPVQIPPGVKVSIDNTTIRVEGPKAKLSMDLPSMVCISIEGNLISLSRKEETKKGKAMHGMVRSILSNLIAGVANGFRKDLEIVGVGYRAQVAGNKLTLNLGYSHPVEYAVPEGVTVSVADNTKLSVSGADKQLVGQVAATIRKFRPPEPYKGKGIRYDGEHITLKEGKTVG
ncbi:MAG: 50S ribosomal protein L6 [Victivallales bacterium]|nr:50S ribosomal protein L6 [Victivallales bacterium]